MAVMKLRYAGAVLVILLVGCSGNQSANPNRMLPALGSQSVPDVLGRWTTEAPMPTARQFLGAGVVNGKLYAVGGYTGGVLDTVEAYDPATNAWRTRASMPTMRCCLAAGVVHGILYAVGASALTL